MEPDDLYFVKLAISNVAFCGFVFSCFGLGLTLMLELGVAMGVLRRRKDDDDE